MQLRPGDDDDDDDDDDHETPPEGKPPEDKFGELVGKSLLEQRIIMVTKPVSRDLMAAITAQLLILDHKHPEKPITMYLNCPGGDADSGFGIYDAMQFIRAPITTVCMGLAASAAIIIFLGGKKGRRFAVPHSRFLIHQPSTMSQGTAADIEITAKEIIKLRDSYNAIIARETGKSEKQIVKDANRDFWLTAEEAKEYGLVNKIVTSMADVD